MKAVSIRFNLTFWIILLLCFGGYRHLSALTITMSDVGATPMTDAQWNAFQVAADRWESFFHDPIKVDLLIAFDDQASNILGSTRSARTRHSFSNVRAALIADADSTTEEGVMNALPTTSFRLTDVNGGRTERKITMTTANAKALGLGTGLDNDYSNPPVGIDGVITFNTDFAATFDYDPSDGITPNTTDFVAVAVHEIGHALGFFSLTDTQDINPDWILHPNTLDLYRFGESVQSPSLNTGIRFVKAGPAQYYDTVLNGIPMSHGRGSADPQCNSAAGTCQASHWSDDQGNILDPSLGRNVVLTVQSDDVHALDYIGYDRRTITISRLVPTIRLGLFSIDKMRMIPSFDGKFDKFPKLPSAEIIKLIGDSNLAFRIGLEFEGTELSPRSGLGFAKFRQGKEIEPNVVRPDPDIEGQQNLNPPGEPATFLPPNFEYLVFQSDLEGTPFVFNSTCSDSGCQYDPELGDFGGFRIPGFVDGEGDGLQGDIDAFLTLIVLMDEFGIPSLELERIFEGETDYLDQTVILMDHVALGAKLPPICGDAGHPYPEADITRDCRVNFKDLIMLARGWLDCTDIECP